MSLFNRFTQKRVLAPTLLLTLTFALITTLLSGCHNASSQHYQGYIEAENTYLASPYSGILMNLGVQRGAQVVRGQFLFQLDENPQAIQLKRNLQDIAQAKHLLQDLYNPLRPDEISAIKAQIAQVASNIALAELRVQRFKQLFEKNAAAKDTLDEAIDNLDRQKKLKEQYEANLSLGQKGAREEQIKAQQKKIESLNSQYEEVKWELAQKRMLSPANGMIYDTYFTEGAFVAAGQAVLSLLVPEHIFATFFVPKEELPNLKLGQAVQISCDNCTKTGRAFIRYISPEAEYLPPLVYSRENNEKIVFRVRAYLTDYQYFKPGLPVMVTIP